ncbi:uncharacterized protein METZ01_LOCUS259870, partial [marine metagenome]
YKLLSKGNRTSMHSPFPESSRKRQDGYVMFTVFFIPFRPRTVGTSKVGFQEEDVHGAMTYRKCIIYFLNNLG